MASPAPQPTTPDTISNFRDISSLINNPPPHPPTLKPSLFYRSALPATATPTAIANLTTTHHIKTVLDLRTDTEILEEADKQKSKPPSSTKKNPSPPPSTTSTPPQQPKTTHLSLNGPAYTHALLSRLTYPQYFKLAFLYTLRYRTQAISVLGENVMSPRGLSGLALDTLTHSTSEIATLFTLLSKPETYPVLVHCTLGKDRTGLVALLVALLCGAGEEGVRRDYERSGVELEPEREEREREVAKIGLSAGFAGVEEGWVGVVCGWLEREWGGVEGYLRKGCGVGGEVVEGVRRILMVREEE
ncbi:hypothetical protein MBLNU13_g06554t1 [Cladosporium sp. NU13]